MRYIRKTSLSRALLAFSITVLLLTPLNVFFKVTLKADSWILTTDTEFSENNSYIKKLTAYSDQWLYILPESSVGELNVYEYYQGELETVADFLNEDPDIFEITDISFAGGGLFMALDTASGPKLYKYNGVDWTNMSDNIPATINRIDKLENINGSLLLWTFEDDGEVDWSSFYYTNSTATVWTQISDDNSFGEIDSEDLQYRKAMFSNGSLVVLLKDTDSEDSIMYRYNNDAPEYTWFEFLTTSTDLVDMTNISGTIYLMGGETILSTVYWFVDVNTITPISSYGFDEVLYNYGVLGVYDNTLYAVISGPYNVNAVMYRYNGEQNEGEWEQVSSYIGADNPGDKNAYVRNMIPFQQGFAIDTGIYGDGLFNPAAWLWSINDPEPNTSVQNTGLNNDDDCTEIDLGFDFQFYDETFSSVYVNTNGTLNFLDCYDNYNHQPLDEVDESALEYTIFPMWFDIDSGGLSNILYQLNGEEPNRTWTIQWTNTYTNEQDEYVPLGTFQVILSEGSNEIQLQYKYLMQGDYGRGREATIGIAKDPENYVQYSYNERSLRNRKTIKFTPDGDFYTMSENVPYKNIYLVDELMPTAPILLAPANNANNQTSPILSWENSEGGGVYGYDILISTSEYFEVGIIDDSDFYEEDNYPENEIVLMLPNYEDIDPDEPGTSQLDLSEWIDYEFEFDEGDLYTFTGLEEDTRYYWVVVARGEEANEISEVRSFCTGEDCPSDMDGDGVEDDIENAAPNGGDANNDGTLDSEQENVTSFVNPLTGSYVVLATTCYSNTFAEIVSSSSLGEDTGFGYPGGLLNFALECAVGTTPTVTQYFFGLNVDISLVVARKFSEASGFKTISGAEITTETIGGLNALVITYQIQDGGDLDENGLVDGIIIDPSGPALNSAGVPNTGLGGSKRV